MSGLVWLASYPKSGNTWFRIFLENFLRDGSEPADINELKETPIASLRAPVDAALGWDSGDVTPEEIEGVRSDVHLHWARRATETRYFKIHDAYTFLPNGRALIPPEAIRCALYFVRNPLDVCVSFARHNGYAELERTIREMASATTAICGDRDRQSDQLPQKLLTWSAHVTSWADAPGVRVRVVRYEDMKLRPEQTFAAAVRFIGLPDDAARVKKAIAFSQFEEVRQQEEKAGFHERMGVTKSFFRKGEAGAWRDELTAAQARRLITDHEAVMRRFGYLDARGDPVF